LARTVWTTRAFTTRRALASRRRAAAILRGRHPG
jgi:hypothetical protein